MNAIDIILPAFKQTHTNDSLLFVSCSSASSEDIPMWSFIGNCTSNETNTLDGVVVFFNTLAIYFTVLSMSWVLMYSSVIVLVSDTETFRNVLYAYMYIQKQ